MILKASGLCVLFIRVTTLFCGNSWFFAEVIWFAGLYGIRTQVFENVNGNVMKMVIRAAFFVLSVLSVFGLNAQTLDRSVIGAMGGYTAPPGGPELMNNMGETYTALASGGGVPLTQGFEQPDTRLPAISGNPVVCVSATTILSDTLTGGLWTSADTSVAIIDSVSGTVSGISAGTAIISYTVLGDTATITVTVNPLADAGAINGPSSVCVGNTITLSESIAVGNWSSSSTSAATIGSTGIVTGLAAGTTNISYSCTNVCGTTVTTYEVTIDPLPDAGTIHGLSGVCAGSTITLSDSVAGGSWISSNTSAATIGSTGIVTGLAAGITTITYSSSGVCGTAAATYGVTVNPLPDAGAINGLSSVCVGSSITLSDPVAGGNWSSSNTSVATTGSMGIVAGVAAGTSSISYSYANVCGTAVVTYGVTVDPLPGAGAITGLSGMCVGSSITLRDSVAGGGWSSSNPSAATIAGSGIVTGVAAGTANITYSSTNGCGTAIAAYEVTVEPAPYVDTISGVSSVCPGSTVQLSDSTAGGMWLLSNTTNATISISGLVTGILPGVDTVGYMVTNSCGTVFAERTITVSLAACSLNNNISIYPNPNPGTFTINGAVASSGEVHIDIRDLVGQSVYKGTGVVTNGRIDERITLANLANGIYLVNVTVGSSVNVFHVTIVK